MDKLTRNWLIGSAILLILLVFSLYWTNSDLKPRIWGLDAALQDDPVLQEYPYHFRALTFLSGIVTVSTPRAQHNSLDIFLRTEFPELAKEPENSPAMQQAAEKFEKYEWRAIEVMMSQSGVVSVNWALDRAWYNKRGLEVLDRF